jgi:ubiquinone/menaquinone biosynthesis C-methylase UbiE
MLYTVSMDERIAKACYDEVDTVAYDEDMYGILNSVRRIAMQQIEEGSSGRSVGKILDLSVGTGEFLKQLKAKFPAATLHGVDISEKMLEAACRKFAFERILDSAENVARHVPAGSIDLALMHLMLAYVAPEKVFQETRKIMSSRGLLSVVTSTRLSFARLSDVGARFIGATAIHDESKVPDTPEALHAAAMSAGFELLDTRAFEATVTFPDFDSLYRFGVGAGWFAQFFKMLSPKKLKFVRLASFPLFPFTDVAKLQVSLFTPKATRA